MGRKSNWAEIRKAFQGIELPDFISEYYNEMVDNIIFNFKQLSFRHNFPSKIVEIEIAPSATVQIFHGLGVIPSDRIILRNSGNGAITDGEFNSDYIELINRGSITANVKVAILRG